MDTTSLELQINDALELASFGDDLLVELAREIPYIDKQLRELMLDVACPYEFRRNNAFLTIKRDVEDNEISRSYVHDWGSNLREEYLAYLKHSFEADFLDYSTVLRGNEFFTKLNSPFLFEYTIHVQGKYAFALLHNETGIHKLHPYPGNSKTISQIEIEVSPDLSVEYFNENYSAEDLRIDVYRSQGTGTFPIDSAVRITHIPTEIKAMSDSQKSRIGNYYLAKRILAGRLYMHNHKAWSRSGIIREYNREKKTITDKRLKKSFEYSNQIRDVLPEILEETLWLKFKSNT